MLLINKQCVIVMQICKEVEEYLRVDFLDRSNQKVEMTKMQVIVRDNGVLVEFHLS